MQYYCEKSLHVVVQCYSLQDCQHKRKIILNYACCLPWPIMQALCYLKHKPIGSITNVLDIEPIVTQNLAKYVCVVI